MTMSSPARALFALLLAAGTAAAAAAQPAATYASGGDFYLAYRAAFVKARSIDDLLPWMSKSRRDQVAGTPADERAMMFGVVKQIDDHTDVKVVKETPRGNGAELQVQAVSAGSKSRVSATIVLVKEGGAWRLDKESWKAGL